MIIPNNRKKTMMVIAATICGIVIIIYLGMFNPTEYPAPQCIVKRICGFDCPGCGTQRAIHAILHGHIASAWHYNAAIFFALPLAAVYIVNPRSWHKYTHSTMAYATILIAIAAWWIGRNCL